MMEASRRRVTAAIGHSGKVVKRAASEIDCLDSSSRCSPRRPVGDRLGCRLDSPFSNHSEASRKRQRGDGVFGSNGADGNDQIGKDDLRFKLMQKGLNRQAQDDEGRSVDLREKLIRMGQPPPRGTETQRLVPCSRSNNIPRCIPPTRIPDDLMRTDSVRTSYSPRTLDHLRRRSLEPTVDTSRGLSPPRNLDRPKGQHISREHNDIRLAPRTSKYVLDDRGQVCSAPFTTRLTLPPPTLQPRPHPVISSPLPPPMLHSLMSSPLPLLTTRQAPSQPVPVSLFLSQLPPPESVACKAAPLVEDHRTIDSFLNSVGLGKYSLILKAEEVDMPALKQMGESDLKEIGIPMGPRKKIIQALSSPRSSPNW